MTAFLILHYKTTQQTIACVNSILALENSQEVRIMLVDNASNDGSFEELERLYGCHDQIQLLKLTESKGFSHGNNAGYLALTSKEDMDFLVVANNDTLFHQSDFLSLIQDCFQQEHFDVLGPDLYKRRGNKQIRTSPMSKINIDRGSVRRMLRIHEARLAYMRRTGLAAGVKAGQQNGRVSFLDKIQSNYPSMGDFLWMQLIRRYRRLYFSVSSLWDDLQLRLCKKRLPVRRNSYLQGACLIYSRNYFQKCSLPFEPETFFYYEELLLYLKAKRLGLKLVYCPKLKVWHKEGSATGTVGQSFDKTYFVETNYCEAEKIVLKYMDN